MHIDIAAMKISHPPANDLPRALRLIDSYAGLAQHIQGQKLITASNTLEFGQLARETWQHETRLQLKIADRVERNVMTSGQFVLKIRATSPRRSKGRDRVSIECVDHGPKSSGGLRRSTCARSPPEYTNILRVGNDSVTLPEQGYTAFEESARECRRSLFQPRAVQSHPSFLYARECVLRHAVES
jgi:hypothetical protein